MKKWIFVTLAVLVAAASGVYHLRARGAVPEVATAEITRGSIVESIGATGALEAVTTVQVGTQVSGTISELLADFNSLVRRGQVIARLDPSLFETQVEQARSNLVRAEADLERLRVSAEDAAVKLDRARSLSERQLIPASELETAEVNERAIGAQIRSAEAQVTQARAALNQAEVNLRHTIITSPIDGIVISRNVDVGQTVAASMQAPTLFVLAADMAAMRVIASVDEADVGRIAPGQRATFRVDAFPADEFAGTVTQVRLEPIVQQNVVTYAAVVDVPNPELKLKPGMTATVTIEVARRDDVLRVPNAALRFEPPAGLLEALGQPATPAGELRAAAARGGAAPERRFQAPDGEGGAERQMAQRLAQMPVEEREALREEMRQRFGGEPGDQRPGRGGLPEFIAPRPAGAAPQGAAVRGGLVWVWEPDALRPVPVRLGLTDGRVTEVLSAGLEAGTLVATGATMEASGVGSALRSPLTPGGRGMRMVVR